MHERWTVSTQTVRDRDNNFNMHQRETIDESSPDRLLTARGEGIHLYDPEARRCIDGTGGMAHVQVGYGNSEIAAAMANQATALPVNNPWSVASDPASMLGQRLADVAPGELNQAFFTTGGSSAVDSALRFVHFYNDVLGRPKKKITVAHETAYHGSTYLAATVSGRERNCDHTTHDSNQRETASDLVRFLPDVNPALRPEGMSLGEWCDEKVEDFERLLLDVGAHQIGALIVEPVLVNGSVMVPPPGYHARTRALCAVNDILYIADEGVTGFGRLGHWFACKDVFHTVPDIITCASGLTSGYAPLGAVLVSDSLIAELQAEDRADVTFSNEFMNSAHPVSCASALANLNVMEREGILRHVRAVTPHFQDRLSQLQRFNIVAQTHGIGLVGCVEGQPAPGGGSDAKGFPIDDDFGARVGSACEARGLLVRPSINTCVLSPSLIISHDEIDVMFDILEAALTQVESGIVDLT